MSTQLQMIDNKAAGQAKDALLFALQCNAGQPRDFVYELLAKTLLHHLLSSLADYNPHLVDYKLSRIRGTPLGCRRIHSLLTYTGDLCRLNVSAEYQHPLLHLEEWKNTSGEKSEKVENLSGALENLKTAIIQAQRFLE